MAERIVLEIPPCRFIPSTPVLIQFAIASVILAITPGPDMTLFVSRALSQGRAAGFASMAGALSGTLVHTTLVVVGVSALIVASPTAFLVLKIFGAGYLVFLAVQAIRNGSAFKPAQKAGPRLSIVRSFSTGPRRQPDEPEDHPVLHDLPAAIRIAAATRMRRASCFSSARCSC